MMRINLCWLSSVNKVSDVDLMGRRNVGHRYLAVRPGPAAVFIDIRSAGFADRGNCGFWTVSVDRRGSVCQTTLMNPRLTRGRTTTALAGTGFAKNENGRSRSPISAGRGTENHLPHPHHECHHQ